MPAMAEELQQRVMPHCSGRAAVPVHWWSEPA